MYHMERRTINKFSTQIQILEENKVANVDLNREKFVVQKKGIHTTTYVSRLPNERKHFNFYGKCTSKSFYALIICAGIYSEN